MASSISQSNPFRSLNQAAWLILLALAYMPLLLACSKDQPAPTSPARKITATADAPGEPTNLRVEVLG